MTPTAEKTAAILSLRTSNELRGYVLGLAGEWGVGISTATHRLLAMSVCAFDPTFHDVLAGLSRFQDGPFEFEKTCAKYRAGLNQLQQDGKLQLDPKRPGMATRALEFGCMREQLDGLRGKHGSKVQRQLHKAVVELCYWEGELNADE